MPESLPNAQPGALTLQHTRIYRPGIIAMDVAGPPGTPRVFVRVHAPSEDHVIIWHVSSEGTPPAVPSPGDERIQGLFMLTDNLVLIGEPEIGGLIPTELPDGGHRWSIAGKYTYAARIPEGPKAPLTLGHMPWENNSPSENSLPASSFKDTILDKSSSVTPPPLLNPIQGP